MTDLEILQNEVRELKETISQLVLSDRYIFQKNIQIMDGRNIQFALGTGTKIGTATTQKISVYGVMPIVQAGAISGPSGGATVDSQARTAINSIITAIKNFGITA